MAADAYARVTGGLGCAVATSGPGATNLITRICSSYYDSVPVLYLTGQVATFRSKATRGSGRLGSRKPTWFPFANDHEIRRPRHRPYRIRFELQKAVAIARAGRPGPSWSTSPMTCREWTSIHETRRVCAD